MCLYTYEYSLLYVILTTGLQVGDFYELYNDDALAVAQYTSLKVVDRVKSKTILQKVGKPLINSVLVLVKRLSRRKARGLLSDELGLRPCISQDIVWR